MRRDLSGVLQNTRCSGERPIRSRVSGNCPEPRTPNPDRAGAFRNSLLMRERGVFTLLELSVLVAAVTVALVAIFPFIRSAMMHHIKTGVDGMTYGFVNAP